MEKAILLAVKFPGDRNFAANIAELQSLAATAGAEIKEVLSQARDKPDYQYFIGKGKLSELQNLVISARVNLVIVDFDLNPTQQRNLEEAVKVKVIDRTQLILDIFAQHATSHEGIIQVELAQLEYTLPRLAGLWPHLSRLGGGIGTRGPGERQIEVDRRIIKQKMSRLKDELKHLQKSRALRREKRRGSNIPTAAIIGYTNAGKSSLLNSLTDAKVNVEDKLFATLDPVTRRYFLPDGQNILLTDTVRFIQKLPHQLVDAFHTTLEEVTEADLLLHVVDISHPAACDQAKAVYRVLEELKATAIPIITVLNKVDLIESKHKVNNELKQKPYVYCSAQQKSGLDELAGAMEKTLKKLP